MASTTITPMDFPALFQSADSASRRGRRAYLRLNGADLSLIITAAILGGIGTVLSSSWQVPVAAGALFILVLSIVIKLTIKSRRDDKDWFDGRAVAETVKTTAWRYMMRAKPFDDDVTSD